MPELASPRLWKRYDLGVLVYHAEFFHGSCTPSWEGLSGLTFQSKLQAAEVNIVREGDRSGSTELGRL